MDVIVAYLDTMFSPYPTTPRLVEAKAELRAMMEDAYTELITQGHSENEAVGQVITEFGNLDELAPVLGITTDLGGTPTPQAGPAPAAATPSSSWSQVPDATAPTSSTAPTPPTDPPVTLAEAQALAETTEATRWQVAAAIAGFVVSPVPLLLLLATSGTPDSAADNGLLPTLGIVILLAVVAACVFVLVNHNARLRPFERLKKGRFTTSPEVDAWATRLVTDHETPARRALGTAVALWILSAVPVILTGTLSPSDTSTLPLVGVALTLVMVALGLLVLLGNNWANTVAKEVTEEGLLDAREDNAQQKDPVANAVAAIYWPLVVVVYLTWSFLGDAWDRSWVIWPITGVLFGAVMAGLSATRKLRGSQY